MACDLHFAAILTGLPAPHLIIQFFTQLPNYTITITSRSHSYDLEGAGLRRYLHFPKRRCGGQYDEKPYFQFCF
ncbi:hypothetical protein FDK38_002172 [Candidozyma auris]|nr:hypothetical protein FDK38_002172 [[Candida] auris]